MGFDEGRIVLNSDTGIYYSGQTVFGKLIFDQEREKKFRGIYVKLKGFCYVHWRTTHTRTVNGKRETYHVDHTSQEEYLNHKTYLIGSEHGECNIQAGHYEYPFQCPIPTNCPSSYEGTLGHIRYELKAVVDRAFKIDQEKMVAIRVIAPIDLNTEPGAKDPVTLEFNETYYCCCTRSGSAKAVVKLPYSGYIPGQTIPIEIACDNSGSVTIDSIKLTLKKDTKFHAQGTRSESVDVAKLQLGEVASNTSRSFTAELLVPYVDTPNVRQCRYIDVDYRFKVTLSPDGCHRDSSQSRNLVIGTIPVAGSSYIPSDPNQMPEQNVPVVNQPITSHYPGENSPYPSGNPYPGNAPYPGPAVSPYPTNSPYPDGIDHPPYPPPYTATPGGPTPYPTTNSAFEKAPYPGGPTVTPYPTSNTTSEKAPYPEGPNMTPYPTSNAPNPTSNSPYPTSNSPYPTSNSPYPTSNSPYPTSNSPYPTSNSPYPTSNSPYPTSPSPYPPNSVTTPHPAPTVSGLRTGTLGFIEQRRTGATMPQLPQGALPYPISPSPNPFADASAPPPGSPTEEQK